MGTEEPEFDQRAGEAAHAHHCSPTCEEEKHPVKGRQQKTEMLCPWRTSVLALLLIWVGFFVADSRSSVMNENQNTQNNSSPPTSVNTTVSVERGKKAVLRCPPMPLKEVMLVIWTIPLRGKPSCTLTYNPETKETNETCTDRRITWASTPEQSLHLQVDAVATHLGGYYSCDIITPAGNFHHGNDLQVLVAPEVALFQEKNRTAVCQAAAGKPAARIFWTPEGLCDSKSEAHSNDTVTVRSTCHWEPDSVSVVTCLVSHETGNMSLSTTLTLNPGDGKLASYIYYIILPIVILVIMGSIWLLKITDFRKCKLEKPETTPVVEEDEMQPYASYTEKSNPLYDTGTKVRTPQLSHSEVDGSGLQTLPASRS